MIVCGHSKVGATEGGWRITIDEKIAGALNLFPGQNIFGGSTEGSTRLSVSTLQLNPHVSYFRVFMEDVMGSLASIAELFSFRSVNVLSSGAFGLGNIWVSEYIADFKGMDVTADDIVNDIQGLGGFVTSREITEFFPQAFELESTYEIQVDDHGEMYLLLPKIAASVAGKGSYSILKAWADIQALFIDFFPSGIKLVQISAMLNDIPGALNRLASLIGTQVNMHAIDAQHHEEATGLWIAYGVLEIGSLEELASRAESAPEILKFDVKPLGWTG
ncbi:MAG: hypothetical protein JSV27_10115 [Candidatus Bathyarchaeota archaeon]|nr:MAG: hypothetical protein JSV27_10115 [Candidatus Bathyarchaeota archaeon]